MKHFIRIYKIGLATSTCLVLGIGFQNCGRTNFSSPEQSTQNSTSSIDLPPTNNSVPALVCSVGAQNALPQAFFPTQCLKNPLLPSNTLGLELNNNFTLVPSGQASNSNVFYLDSDSNAGTTKDAYLYFEFATYLAPDTVVVSAVNQSGIESEILNVCNVSTDVAGDPTDGTYRPFSDSILQFNAVLPKGTRRIKFDFTNALTNTYLGIWNLGEFSQALANPANNPFRRPGQNAAQFRVQTTLPPALNDNADPRQPNLCP